MTGLVLLGALLGVSLAGLAVCAWAWWKSRRRAARLRDLLVWRADQISMLSHELRTPLTLVKLSADLLAEDENRPLSPRQDSFVRTIREQALVTIQLAEDLLTQARIEAGRFTLHLTQVDLADLVLASVHDLRELHDRPIMVDCPSAPCLVRADTVLIRQGLTNLVNNAVAVSPPGEPVVVRLSRREVDVLVSVTDRGTGMKAEQRLRLFRRFSSGRPVGSGTGLGLVITKQIVELHGGRLFVDTVEERGTTMMFSLPVGGPSGRDVQVAAGRSPRFRRRLRRRAVSPRLMGGLAPWGASLA